jgi:hypothetical protein
MQLNITPDNMQHTTCDMQHAAHSKRHTTSERGDATLTDVRLAVKVAVKDEAVGLGERPAVAVGQVGRDQDILARFDLQYARPPVGRMGTDCSTRKYCGQPC